MAMKEELRQGQQQLEDSRSRYADLYDSAPIGYFTVAENGLILEANLTGANLLGIERNSLIGKPLSHFVARDDQDVFSRHHNQIFAAKTPQSCEIKLVRKNGTQFHARLESMVTQDHDGNLSGYRTVMSEVSESKRVEEALQESQRKYRFLFESAPVGVVTVNSDGDNLAKLVEEHTAELRMINAQLQQQITERKWAEDELQRNYDIQTEVNSLILLSLGDISLEDTLKRALDTILSIPWFSFESRGGIFLAEHDSEVLVMKAQSGLPEPVQKACARVPFGKCLCGRAALTREIHCTGCLDARHDIVYEEIASRSGYAVPILSADRTIGVIILYMREGHRRDEREEEFLTAIANTLAGIIKRKQAEAALDQERTTLAALYDISSALNSTADINALLKSITRKTKELLNVENASILFWDKRRNELYPPISPAVAGKRGMETRPDWFRPPATSSVAGWVFREGKPALVQDVSADERFYNEIHGNTEPLVRSILCVPLRGREGILGVVEVVNKEEGGFTVGDQRMLEAIADNIAVSIEKANLYRDLQRAEALLRRQNAELRRAVKQKYRFENIIGNSDKIMDVLKKAEEVALTDSTVLIYGETGTGKELLARAIHQSSTRSSKNFVPINCGAIPENLLESELFGHERGAFTGATAQRIGRFEEANGGTLFLDEISDMPLNLQVKLLRVLQESVIQRLGSNENISVDVRVIVATHEDMTQLVAEGRFREDLYYRLKVFELELPPLRERQGDIPLLINHFIAYYNERLGKQIVDIEDAALDILCRYNYPGNIRELQHLIERAMVLCKGNAITTDVLPEEMRVPMKDAKSLTPRQERFAIPRNKEELRAARAKVQQEIEHLFLTELLSSTRGNVSKAARKAGMDRSWLIELIGRHQLDLTQFRDEG
jgi:formate hydrogenlyase transcriptional activator